MPRAGYNILVAADLHIPLHSVDATEQLIERVRHLHPNAVCLNGDILDFDSLSLFLSDPTGKKLQEELDIAREFLDRFRSAIGRAKWSLCLGNHEDRLRQYLWKNPAISGLRALELSALLGLPKDKCVAYGEPVFYGSSNEVAVYHTETMGKANKNNTQRALDRITRTGSQVTVTSHMHASSCIWTHDRQGCGCSVVTPCLQNKQEWSKPFPNWDIGWTEITILPGRYPIAQQVIL